MKKRQKEIYIEKKGIIGVGDDYHVYHMKRKDRAIAFLIGFAGALVVFYVFFKNILFAGMAGIAAGFWIQPYYCSYLCKKRKKALLLQFRDMLESLTSSYSAGRNTQGAFEDAYRDMLQIYGQDADIVKELKIILTGISNNLNIENLLKNFADRSEQTDIASFADVFEVSVRQGGNIKDIISSTRDIISDKIEIELEIGTLLAGNRNELNIMMLMPLVISVSMEGMGSSASGNSPLNIVIKMIALGTFIFAYLVGQKITAIKL